VVGTKAKLAQLEQFKKIAENIQLEKEQASIAQLASLEEAAEKEKTGKEAEVPQLDGPCPPLGEDPEHKPEEKKDMGGGKPNVWDVKQYLDPRDRSDSKQKPEEEEIPKCVA